MRREALLARLSARRHDLLVIGGGIVGAGIARDAAMRGLKVALVEQQDFAGGTSSKTSKLIHGGLRYLEHGALGLVFEALRERKTLRAIAPSLVRPLSLLLPVYAQDPRPAWMVDVGLSLYDLLAAGRNLRLHRMLSPQRASALEPALRIDGLRGAGLFSDCLMDDARLCLVNILQALGLGAVCCNYVQVRAFLKASGELYGAVVEDRFTGRTSEVHATQVVNATGPWADQVRRLSDPHARAAIAPTKGIHLVLPAIIKQPLFVQARDRRMLFLLPWHEGTLAGTTERVVQGGLDQLRAEPDEVGYLLEEINRVIPGARLGPEDVVTTFAGARPLLAYAGAPGRASREHRIEVDRWGLVSVMGGKYTTYRAMAAQTVQFLIRRNGWTADRGLTDQVALVEPVRASMLERWRDSARGVDPDLLARLVLRYGAGAYRILQLMGEDAALAKPVCAHHEELEAELVYAMQEEFACTMTDVLARRTHIAWSPCRGLEIAPRLATLFRRYGDKTVHAAADSIADYAQFLAQAVAFRPAAASERPVTGAARRG